MLDYFDKIVKPLGLLPARDRLEFLIDLGGELGELENDEIIDSNKVLGCISNVYVVGSLVNGKLEYRAQADALIVKGYVAILVKALSGLSCDEVINARSRIERFIEEAHVNESLTPSRANAFANVYDFMSRIAIKLSD